MKNLFLLPVEHVWGKLKCIITYYYWQHIYCAKKDKIAVLLAARINEGAGSVNRFRFCEPNRESFSIPPKFLAIFAHWSGQKFRVNGNINLLNLSSIHSYYSMELPKKEKPKSDRLTDPSLARIRLFFTWKLPPSNLIKVMNNWDNCLDAWYFLRR